MLMTCPFCVINYVNTGAFPFFAKLKVCFAWRINGLSVILLFKLVGSSTETPKT